jgi:N4-gp56 family major capsid protein
MAIQNYSTPTASRNLINTEFEMLKRVESIQVLGKFGDQKTQPLNKTDTAVFRRLDPFNVDANGLPQITAANFVGAEGTTPTSNTISYTDVTATVEQYNVLFKFSSKAELMYEDDIPADMRTVTADTLAEVAELVAYGQMKAGTSVIYANGTTRAGLNTRISLAKLQLAARSMESNRATHVTSMIGPGPNFNTAPCEPAFIVFHHTDASSDVKALSGFTKRVEYGSAVTPVHPREIGACDQFRFVPSPLFKPYVTAGSSTTNGMVATSGSVDVYPFIIIGESAMGHISLKGNGYTGISPTIISSKVKNHANPSAKFGYVGADFWYAAVRLNENWMTRLEAGVTDLAL